jgi:alkyl sulfatase BDS1-like metallo-beta-lactamase superfamily hydrolase
MTVEAELAQLVDRFNRRAETNPAVSEELSGLDRTIRLRLTDEESYTVDLRGGRLGGLRTSASGPADITITTDVATFQGLVRREIGPMKAIFGQKLKIEGSLDDKLLFRRLL